MLIRVASEHDYAGLCRLWAEVDRLHAELLPDFFQAPGEVPRSRGELRRRLAADDLLMLVAEAQRELLGLAEARLVDTPRQRQLTPRRRLYLEELVVGRAWRRRGIGRALLEAVEEWGRRQGARQTLLTVWEGNREAQAFYARLGFRPVNQVLGRAL